MNIISNLIFEIISEIINILKENEQDHSGLCSRNMIIKHEFNWAGCIPT